MIYVDKLKKAPPGKWKHGHACHLFSDVNDIEELHEFAQSVGLRREWFQDRKGFPHYDLTAGRRRTAVSLGAIEVTRVRRNKNANNNTRRS